MARLGVHDVTGLVRYAIRRRPGARRQVAASARRRRCGPAGPVVRSRTRCRSCAHGQRFRSGVPAGGGRITGSRIKVGIADRMAKVPPSPDHSAQSRWTFVTRPTVRGKRDMRHVDRQRRVREADALDQPAASRPRLRRSAHRPSTQLVARTRGDRCPAAGARGLQEHLELPPLVHLGCGTPPSPCPPQHSRSLLGTMLVARRASTRAAPRRTGVADRLIWVRSRPLSSPS